MNQIEIKNTTLIIAFVTSSLYVFGTSFYQGYLSHWGIEESLLPQAFEKTLFYGFLGASYLGAKSMVFLMLAVSANFGLAAASFALFERLKRRPWFRHKFTRKVKSQKTKSISTYIRYSGWGVLIAYWVFVVFLLSMILLWSAGYMGQFAAKNHQAHFENSGLYRVKVTLASGLVEDGMSIICSATHCAYLVCGKARVWPVSKIEMVESVPPEA